MSAKIASLLVAAWFTMSFMMTQNKDYVCVPCGNDCDIASHSGPGTCSSCGMTLVEKSTIRFNELSWPEFCKRTSASSPLILDVRSPGEFSGTNKDIPTFGHFKNAVNINVTELERRVSELSAYKDKEVLVYCSHSHRSPQASYFLSTHGFKNVTNMSGGVSTFPGNEQDPCLKANFVFHTR